MMTQPAKSPTVIDLAVPGGDNLSDDTWDLYHAFLEALHEDGYVVTDYEYREETPDLVGGSEVVHYTADGRRLVVG